MEIRWYLFSFIYILLAECGAISYNVVMKKSIFALFAFFMCATFFWGQAVSTELPIQNSTDSERPSVALVLSGAGARGFAHIAVIELLEELGIPIDMVIGTSSGAIIGGLYSAGYSGAEIAENMVYVDWPMLLQDSTVRSLEDALGSHSSETNFFNLQLDNTFSLNLGRGLLSGQYIYSKMKELTGNLPSYIDFDNLPTPYRAVAVDLLTGELVIIDEGDISEAMRASMSIPGAFEPFPIDDRFFLDGFIRNNLPVAAVKDLGYDIVIAVEMSDKMAEDADAFNSTPIVALNQILALQQAVVTTQEYEYADLVLFPDLYEFGQMDYAYSPEVYEKGKVEVERYREDLIALRSKIFPEMADAEYSGELYQRKVSYNDVQKLKIEELSLHGVAFPDDKMLTKEFDAIKENPIGGKEIDYLLSMAYQTGNYTMVKARINTLGEKPTLELDFIQKNREAVQVGNVEIFEGSLSRTATWEITVSTTLQFRNLNDLGGVLSLQVAFLNNSIFELLYLQPINENIFLRAKANIFSTLDIENSGFENIELRDSQFRHATLALAGGVFFSPEHKVLAEVGAHWIDSTKAYTDDLDIMKSVRDLEFAYTLDAFTRYTFDTLDFPMFPTNGFFNDLNIMGVLPIKDTTFTEPFDVLSTNFVLATSFNDNISLVLNGFIGTNVTQGLAKEVELVPMYGFTTYDRDFFPHVMQRYMYGIHKLALKADFQFKPSNQLTILGGQFLSGVGGAIGGVWDSYASLANFDDLDWQASAMAGVRIRDSIGVMIRAGAGNYKGDIAPFVSLDLMVKSY